MLIFVFGLQIAVIDTYADNYSFSDISQLSDYDYYSAFAKALKNHDAETIALFIPCNDSSQFKYEDVNISGYSVEILEKNREGYEGVRKAAKITLNIEKSNNLLFPEGKQKYYVYLDPYDGMYGTYKFYPYSVYKKTVDEKYSEGLWISMGVASYMTDYESASSSKIKKMEYAEGYIHYFYHVCLQDDYPDGISKAALTTELNKFYGSKKQISKEVLDGLWKKDGLYFKQCGHGMPIDVYSCQKITKNKKTGYYTYDIWFYSDAAAMNVCRKIKFTYDISNGDYVLKQVNCYYSNDYDVMSL